MKDPLRHHNQQHRELGVDFENCRRCTYDRATCAKKIRFADEDEAIEWVRDFNDGRSWRPPLMAHYRCRWCDGFHMKTAKDKRERVRSDRLRRQWGPPSTASEDAAFALWVRTGRVEPVGDRS